MQLLWVSVKDFIEELEGAVCFFSIFEVKTTPNTLFIQ